jgi:two-component system sensor histidine kinase DegS
MKKVKTSVITVSFISVVLLISIVFCSFGYVYYNRQKAVHLSELYSSLTTTANQLSKGLSIAVWNFDEEQIEGILQSGLLDKNIDEIIIEYEDKDKSVLTVKQADSTFFKVYKKKVAPAPGAILIKSDITYLNENIGKLTVCGTTKFVYGKLRTDLTLIALFILFLVILMIVGMYGIFYFIVIKPLKSLEQFSISIDLENFNKDYTIKKKYFREFDNLSDSLQKMISSLNSSFKKLEESERKFKEMSNLLPVSVFEINLEGKITFINEMGLSLLDLSNKDIQKGVAFSSMVSHENLKTLYTRRALMIETKEKTTEYEYKILKKDGSHFPMMIYASPIFDKGKVVGVRAVGLDLTEQRMNESALKELVQLNFTREKEAEKMKTLSLIEGQEKERLRISREIHDGIGQMITAIKLSCESIDTASINSQEDKEKFGYTKSLIQEVITELRQVSSDLSPTFLYDYGLFSAVNQLVINVSKISSINIKLNSNIQKNRFQSLVEITLYRIIQEAINNTLKHSQAKNLKINLILDAEFLELAIEDDGIGFNLTANSKTGNGLNNISSRSNLIGAHSSIIASPGKGFKINIQIPIDNATLPD